MPRGFFFLRVLMGEWGLGLEICWSGLIGNVN